MRRVIKTASKPFENLGALDRLIQYMRLGSSIIVIVLVMVLTVGELTLPNKLYMGKLNTSSMEVAQGLFDALQSSVEATAANYVNNGVGLTTAEITILAEYTASQVRSSPQHIVTSVYGWCRIDNTSSSSPKYHNTTCYTMGSTYVFDYRDLMRESGLNAILQYTYNSKDDFESYASSYETYMRRSRELKDRMIDLLYVAGTTQVAMLISTLWYYSVKGRSLNMTKQVVLVHSISILSLGACICALVSVINIVAMSLRVRSKIRSELYYLNISYHLGSVWFALLGLLAVFSCFSCTVWSGLEWCITERARSNEESFELGILATAGQSVQDESTAAVNQRPPDPTSHHHMHAPPDGESSQLQVTDEESENLLRPVATATSGYSEVSRQRIVVPISAFSL